MFGNGTSALASYYLGQKDSHRANQLFTSMTVILFIIGIILSSAMYILVPSIARFLGAPENMIPSCTEYRRVLAVFMPLQMVNMSFQPLLIAADKPGLGLVVSIANAILNIFLDWFMVAFMRQGLFGAAVATGIAWAISAFIPFIYFFRKTSILHFTDISFDFPNMIKAAYNGSSEMIDSVAYAIVAMFFNSQLLKYAGKNGVASYAVTEYIGSVSLAVFMGISMSITPQVGYALGEGNRDELHHIRNTGAVMMGTIGVIMTAGGILTSEWVARVFVGYDDALMNMAVQALIFVSLSYFPLGLTSFSSAFFTGMNDGTFSLMIAVSKSFVLPVILLFILCHQKISAMYQCLMLTTKRASQVLTIQRLIFTSKTLNEIHADERFSDMPATETNRNSLAYCIYTSGVRTIFPDCSISSQAAFPSLVLRSRFPALMYSLAKRSGSRIAQCVADPSFKAGVSLWGVLRLVM